MIEQEIRDRKYTPTNDTIIKDLNSFQYFLRKYFKNSPFYNNIFPSYNQPARFFATAKTHKFNNLYISIQNFHLRPIIDQINTAHYNSAKMLSNYLKPISYKKYTINNTQVFQKCLVKPAKPIFYRRYVDDIYIRKKKLDNTLHNSLANFHHNLKFTTQLNSKKILDTSIHKLDNGTYNFRVVNKINKMPFHWSAQVPIHYKGGVVKNELLRAKSISSNFEKKVRRTLKTYTSAGYPK